MHINIYHHGSPAKILRIIKVRQLLSAQFHGKHSKYEIVLPNIFFSKISSPNRFIRKHTLPCIVTTIHLHPTYYQGPPASLNTFYQILIAKTKTVLLTCMLYSYLFYKIGHHVVSNLTNFQGPPTSFIYSIYLFNYFKGKPMYTCILNILLPKQVISSLAYRLNANQLKKMLIPNMKYQHAKSLQLP